MLLTKEQISEQMRKHAEKKNGLHDLMEIIVESTEVQKEEKWALKRWFLLINEESLRDLYYLCIWIGVTLSKTYEIKKRYAQSCNLKT